MGNMRKYSDYTDSDARETLLVLSLLVAILARLLDWSRGLEAVILGLVLALLLPWPLKAIGFAIVWCVDLFGKFMSTVILAVLYIAVFTPVALVRRAFLLLSQGDHEPKSWFVERKDQTPDADSFTRPF